MKFYIVATAVLVTVLAILAISIDTGSSNTPAAAPSSLDEGALKGLKF